MDRLVTRGTTSPPALQVSVSCLHCHSIFVAQKYFRGPRGRFRVSSRALALHLRSNRCEGPCLAYYLQRKLSTNDFASSLVTVEQQAPLIPSSSPLSSSLQPVGSAGYDASPADDFSFQCEDDESVAQDSSDSKSSMSFRPPLPSSLFDETSIHPSKAFPPAPRMI
jgi:hypothetical protein